MGCTYATPPPHTILIRLHNNSLLQVNAYYPNIDTHAAVMQNRDVPTYVYNIHVAYAKGAYEFEDVKMCDL